MEKTRGIVMKASKKNIILYTEQGDYLKIKTPQSPPLLGQTIEVELPVHKGREQRLLQFGSIAAVLLLALGLGLFNIVSNANTAVAAVVMDINNSKELLVNRDAKVLRVIDLPQGNQASSSELQGKDIYTSVNLLIDQANSQGALKQEGNLVMASVIPIDKRQTDTIDQTRLRDSISRHLLEKNISADLMVSSTDETSLKTAQNLKMSINYYLVYKRLTDMGFDVSPKDSGPTDTSHMLTEANTTLKSLFPQDSMMITPQRETTQKPPSPMGTPMPNEQMQPDSSQKSGSKQKQSPSDMMNTSPPSNQTKHSMMP